MFEKYNALNLKMATVRTVSGEFIAAVKEAFAVDETLRIAIERNESVILEDSDGRWMVSPWGHTEEVA